VSRAVARFACVALLVVAAAPVRATETIDDFFTAFTDEWMRADPDLARRARYFDGATQDALDRSITPKTLAWKRERIERARRALATLATFERAAQSDTERLSADLMRWQLQKYVDEEPFLGYRFPIEQLEGGNVTLVWALTNAHPFARARDVDNYLAALAQVATRMDEIVADARALDARNVRPPRFILDATVAQLSKFIAGDPAGNPFVTALREKSAAIADLAPDARASALARATAIVGRDVVPAWQRAIDTLTAQRPRATDEAGIWRFADGAKAYRFYLGAYTTTTLSADEIHDLGLRRVAEIEQRMDEVLRAIGRSDGSVRARIAALRADLAYPEPISEASRAAVMRDIDAILADAHRRAAPLFERRPRAEVVARPYPDYEETNQAARSLPPAPDGSRPGVFMFPRRIERMTQFGLRTLTYHEAVPGHFFQVGLQIENPAVPKFRRSLALGSISAFVEGWALYAERLAAESGWYDDDPQGLLGQLDAELFRARRLVVDTGLHAKRWTRQQAIDYGIEPAEVERYVVNPGQACAYMIGQLKILELRERMQAALGERFDLRAFHTFVLDTGTVPLEILEARLDQHIAAAGT
jgi:uncharacterized protein (DUF885 family)